MGLPPKTSTPTPHKIPTLLRTRYLFTDDCYSDHCHQTITKYCTLAETMPTIILNMRTNGKDYLTPLPAEVQHNIIGYLFCSHDSDHIATYNPGATDRKHALDNLAATSKSLRNEVMAFARTWLLKHYDITDSSKKSSSSTGKVNYLRGMFGARGTREVLG